MDGQLLDDGAMSYRVLPADGVPSAAVVFAHGFAEGALRHAATLAFLAASHVAAYAFDLMGHGRSPGTRGFVRRFDDLLHTERLVRARVRAAHPGVPIVLMGYSLGGLLAVRSAQRDPDDIAGVVLIAPGLGIATNLPAFVRTVGVAFGEIAPRIPVARLRLRHLRPDEPRFTSVLERILPRDPLIPARTAAEAIRASDAALAGAARWTQPTIIVQGDLDRVVPIASARRFAALATHADIAIRIVRGGHHDLLTGTDAPLVRDDVVAWIRSHVR